MAMETEVVFVECYSGYKVNERPRAFVFRGKRRIVADILDRWYEGGTGPGRPPLDYFKIRTEEGEDYILCYHSLFDRWAVVIPGGKDLP
ncbi:MAG TPA: hypothetical protein PKL99_01705 [Syntrophales bacterium]|nr:hypothetical protein [Syntrophales bacterium]